MKDILKNLLKEISTPVISEKLANVDEDVNFIYNQYFKKDYDEILKTGVLTTDMFLSDITDTSVFTSELSRKAHELNPCKIKINLGGNFYQPNANLISLGVNRSAVDFIIDEANGSIEKATKMLDDSQVVSLKREFKESSIKGSIHHEIAHWIDDTLHNRHLTNRLKKANEPVDGVKKKKQNYSPISISTITSKMEIEGQIHNIKQLKNRYESIWEQLSFDDMIKLSPSLMNISKKLVTVPEIYKQWRRNLLVRMHREGLLSKEMAK